MGARVIDGLPETNPGLYLYTALALTALGVCS